MLQTRRITDIVHLEEQRDQASVLPDKRKFKKKKTTVMYSQHSKTKRLTTCSNMGGSRILWTTMSSKEDHSREQQCVSNGQYIPEAHDV